MDPTSDRLRLLTPTEMGTADHRAVELGVASLDLMENAGRAVAEAALGLSVQGPISVLCGPGNNGGDGFVAARLIKEAGIPVEVFLLGDIAALRGDAAANADRYEGEIQPLAAFKGPGGGVIIDAIFGAGLSRDIDGVVADVIESVNRSGRPVVAVDVPTGIDGASGKVRGCAIRADRTVTFFRYKPGHCLLPGRTHCGAITLADIGIPEPLASECAGPLWRNGPDLWRGDWQAPSDETHKYHRGHAMVVAGPRFATGAARLAAEAALRAGSGLVTLAGSPSAVDVMATQVTEVMLAAFSDEDHLNGLLDDPRRNAWLIGPGLPESEASAALVMRLLETDRMLVLDAGALTNFAGQGDILFEAIQKRGAPTVLTPHEGEFKRLFGEIEAASKVERARIAAEKSGAIVILKGGDTVIAAPDGRAAIETEAPPWLATAGSGDVLAGIVVSLLGQGIPAFQAAAMAVWLHGACGRQAGLGLIAGDLAPHLGKVLQTLYKA